jgi:hypothetical protein
MIELMEWKKSLRTKFGADISRMERKGNKIRTGLDIGKYGATATTPHSGKGS